MAFLGMRGDGDWAADQRPKHWREMILYLYPNGSAPLTAMLSKMKSQKVSDPEYNWWTKNLASQSTAVSAVYGPSSDTGVNDAGATAGQFIWVDVTSSTEFRVGHQVLLRDASVVSSDCNAKVVEITSATKIKTKLLEDDPADPSAWDTIMVIGSINAEGAGIPDALAYDPVKYYNYTQIFRTSLDITRTARKTRLRTGDQYKEMKRECLELHSIEMEKAFFHGIKSENTGSNSKPERTSQGIISFIKEHAAANVFNYTAADDSVASSAAWITSGENYLDVNLEKVFRHGSQEKVAFCGSGAVLGINQLAKKAGQVQLRPRDGAYGLKVVEWLTPFGTLMLKTHPLFSYEATNRNRMVVVDPEKIQFNYIDDTFFKKDDQVKKGGSYGGLDATKEEFLTEGGLEMHHPLCHGIFDGVGLAAPS